MPLLVLGITLLIVGVIAMVLPWENFFSRYKRNKKRVSIVVRVFGFAALVCSVVPISLHLAYHL